MEASPETIETRIPARMHRLPWSSWHWLVVLGLSEGQLGLAGTIYVVAPRPGRSSGAG